MTKTSVDSLTVLGDMELVRHRFNVYLDAHQPFDNAAREVLDNAIDQVNKSRTTEVHLISHPDGSLEVRDGAGTLPTAWQETPKGNDNGIVTALARIGSSTNYDSAVGAGTNGIGAAAANALSRRMDVIVVRDGKRYEQRFSKGVPGIWTGSTFDPEETFTEKRGVRLTGEPTTEDNYTSIRLIFDPSVAPEVPEMDWDMLVYRARLSAAVTPGTRLHIHRDGSHDVYEGDYGIEAVARLALGLDTPAVYTSQVGFQGGRSRNHPSTVDMAVYLSDDPRTVGLSNSVYTPDGGSHITGALNGFARAVAEKIARMRGLGLERGEEPPTAKDVESVVSLVVSMRQPDTRYTGQHKNGVSDARLARVLADTVGRDVTAWTASPDSGAALTRIAQAAIEVARTRRADEARKQARRKSTSGQGMGESLSWPAKFIPCKRTGRGSGAELHITEGDSAAGGARAARDALTQAIMPVRGVMKSAFGKTRDAMVRNAEFVNLEKVLGCGSYENCDPNECRFDRIIFATDADAHGKFIAAEGICLMYEAFRPLLEAGMVYVCVPPLYVVRNDTTSAVAYAVDDTEKRALQESWAGDKVSVQRCKGLGEMLPEDYAATMMDPSRRTLRQIIIDDNAYESLRIHFASGAAAERRAWLERRAQEMELDTLV